MRITLEQIALETALRSRMVIRPGGERLLASPQVSVNQLTL